jgi:ketosteroid isomerase-like protein
MSAENLLRETYARYGKGDLDGALALCHEDVVFGG